MDIVMLVAGAGVGAMLRDLFVLHRGDKNKTRQQLEDKTPYDYALTNAINERDRLQDELRSIQALKRTEADTERIRNEIGTILTDDGEEAAEGVYEPNIGMPIQDNGDGTFSPISWDSRISSGEMADNISKVVARVYGTNVREVEHVVTSGETLTTIARKYGVKIWDIVEDNDILIYDDLNEIGVIFVGQRLKIRDNVREDGTEDEQLPDNGVEYADLEAIDKAIRDEQKVLCIYRNRNVGGFSGVEMAVGTLAKLRYHYGQTQYAILRVCRNNEGDTYLLRISGEDLEEISVSGGDLNGKTIYRKGDDTSGETLYRKGNR